MENYGQVNVLFVLVWEIWKMGVREKWQGFALIANFLEVIVSDEETTLLEHNRLCNANHDVFSKDKKPK